MKKRILSLLLAAALLLAALACPALADAASVDAQTTLSGASENKLNNIRLAAAALNGQRVRQGERFSFNSAVGARSQARGYRSAVNGRGVNVTGGGVSQVATTLYLALLKLGADVRFNALSTYGSRFKDNYVSDGSLAVITDYSADIDFCFTSLADDLQIEMWVSGGWLNCRLARDSGFGGNWFENWQTPQPTWQPFATQAPYGTRTVTARIPFEASADTADNIRLAADSVNDTALASGDVFSFNRVVGPRTGAYGYTSGTNGRGVRVTGGGVAQVASVIWLAVKNMDDVEILKKSTYGKRYNQDYVDSAADAIVTDYKAGTDFSFRYTGAGTITIYTYVEGDSLRCDVVRE